MPRYTDKKHTEKIRAAASETSFDLGQENSMLVANENPKSQVSQRKENSLSNPVQTVQLTASSTENKTGLPDDLKAGIEHLSGISLDDVNVQRNSSKPAQLKAHALAQGTNIHLGPGQEHHLPHETWHVVQQKQGRVKPTHQLTGRMNINKDEGLEKEADIMSSRALEVNSSALDENTPLDQEKVKSNGSDLSQLKKTSSANNSIQHSSAPIQLAAIETDWGKFIDTDYNLVEDDQRLNADFHFEPGDNTDATKIAFSQAVKLVKDGSPTYHDPAQKDKMSDDGYRIDRLGTKNNPVYGAPSLGAGKGIEDNSGSNSKYELGYHYTKEEEVKKKNAFMHDKPGGLTDKTSMEFETTALAIEGAQKGKYYGSFSWGWKKDAEGEITKLPFTRLSKGDPTEAFMGAAKKWNDSKSRGTVVTVSDDTPCYKWESGYVEKFKLPKDVKVKRKSASFSDMGPLQKSEILTGDHTGDEVYIKVADLKDKGDGKDTVDLPLLD